MTSRPAVARSDLTISRGADESAVIAETQQLVGEGKWKLSANGKGLERGFKFKSFKSSWDFMSDIAAECKKQRHHPEWTNVFNRTHIRWTTHNPEGLSLKDTLMARFCDDAGARHGEQPLEGDDVELKVDEKLTAGNCCGSKNT